MQTLAQTSSAGSSYSVDQVSAMLVGPSLQYRWIFDRIQMNGIVNDLTPYVSTQTVPEITHDSSAAVKRSLRLELRGDAPTMKLNELIRPHCQIRAPDGGWLDWSLGTFVLSPPQRIISPSSNRRIISAMDYTQLFVDAEFTTSFGVAAGQSYIRAMTGIAQQYGGQLPLQFDITDSGQKLPASLGWSAGQTRLAAINQLGAAIGYVPLWADAAGVLRAYPTPDYTALRPSFTFDETQHKSIAVSPFDDQPDVANLFNVIVVNGEDERRASFSVTLINDGDAEASTINWRPKVKVLTSTDIIDAATARRIALSELQASARNYSVLQVDTLPWPVSEDRDLYGLVYNNSDDGLQSNTYVETKWIHRCAVGQMTSHFLERVVPV